MAKKIIQRQSRIVFNGQVTEGYFKTVLECPEIAAQAMPGQFIQVKISSSLDPLLRRPFSIHRVVFPGSKRIEILYQLLGKGTELLSQKKNGELLDTIGPLGNGFDYIPYDKSSNAILVAGGMGVAPLVFLAEKITGNKSAPPLAGQVIAQEHLSLGMAVSRTSAKRRKVIVFIGARTKEGILCEKEFKRLGCIVKIATDDGSTGFRGRVTDLLKTQLSTVSRQLPDIYGCGPKPMLKELAMLSAEYKIPAQISLESHMACGIGACLGCVIETTEGFKRVCKEGPVFDADKINWPDRR